MFGQIKINITLTNVKNKEIKITIKFNWNIPLKTPIPDPIPWIFIKVFKDNMLEKKNWIALILLIKEVFKLFLIKDNDSIKIKKKTEIISIDFKS